ncbi:MAG: PqqD family protein [Bacteroidetes bacterium]|nr:PqqD family protein [Bacteroidales bacterium]MBU1009152.1 PqqD family protein [Bacteroidota bacterium]
MKIKNNIAVSENGFVFNPASGESFSVNTVGLEILNMLRKGHSAVQIIQSINDHFHAEPTVIERDLNDFIETLRQYHMIDHDED